MRSTIVLLLLYSGIAGYAQEPILVDVTGGLVFPTGENLRNAYTIGVELGLQATFRTKNAFFALEGTCELFRNFPPSSSSVADNLYLFGPALHVGYSFEAMGRKLEPFVSIGYEWGVNSISDRSLFSHSVDLIDMKGFAIGPGLTFRISERASVSLVYRFYSPDFAITQYALTTITNSATPTQLYGPIYSFPAQSFSMDRLALKFCWTP